MSIFIKYKEYEFEVVTEGGRKDTDSPFIRTIVGIETDNDVVSNFNNDVFFDVFVGEDYPDNDDALAKVVRRIKKAFVKFLNNPEEESETPAEKTKTPAEEVKVEVVHKTKKETTKPEGAIDRIIFETVERALGSENSKNEIDVLIKELVKENGIVPFRTIIEVKREDGVKKDVGLQHFEFERILKTISAGVPIALVGPAGSGKTTMVYNVAKSLDMSFASQSVSAQSTTFDFFGYKNAKGEYVSTLFRDKYENGGVFLLDEFDAGNPNVLAALNQATANSIAPFPDKMVEKHKDFIIVMAGNTFGGGGTIDYVGRNKIDAATLDRFAFIYVDYDEGLEEKLAVNKSWCKRVQSFRKLVRDKKVRTIISPRATFNGEKLLASGLTQNQVEEMVIYKGLNSDERNLIKL